MLFCCCNFSPVASGNIQHSALGAPSMSVAMEKEPESIAAALKGLRDGCTHKLNV